MKIMRDGVVLCIERTWSNDYYLGVDGWCLGTSSAIEGIEFRIDDQLIQVNEFYARPDVIESHPDYSNNVNCGFRVQVPRIASHAFQFSAFLDESSCTFPVNVTGFKPPTPDYNNGSGLFDDFQRIVNDKRMSVLEIGSRIVSPGSQSKRVLFPNADIYTGFDIHLDQNTDVVGDAHILSSYFDRQYDAIFSLSVFEHLAMPWKVALEINRLLKNGGITYHSTHNAWPIHDAPWDFYRYTDNGLRSLFSRSIGFETLSCGYWSPVRMHLDDPVKGQELHPHCVSYGGVGILAKKIFDYDQECCKWNLETDEVVNGSIYPLQD